jgi:sarcosine oxidase subunit beta
MPKRTFICRCEDVTLHEVEHAISLGLTSIEDIKRYTGLGTGPCQGKECMVPISRVLADRSLVPADRLQPFTARPPAEPVTFAALAQAPDRLLVESAGGVWEDPEDGA